MPRSPESNELVEHGGRVFEITVDLDRGIAACVPVAGQNRTIEAEITRKAQDTHPRILRGDAFEAFESIVDAVIIGKYDLKIQVVAALEFRFDRVIRPF